MMTTTKTTTQGKWQRFECYRVSERKDNAWFTDLQHSEPVWLESTNFIWKKGQKPEKNRKMSGKKKEKEKEINSVCDIYKWEAC